MDHTLKTDVVTVTLLEEVTGLLEVGTGVGAAAVKVMFKGTLSLQNVLDLEFVRLEHTRLGGCHRW